MHDTLKKRNYAVYAVVAGLALVVASSMGLFDRNSGSTAQNRPTTISPGGKIKLTVSRDSIQTMIDAAIAENPALRENQDSVRKQFEESAESQEMIVAEALGQDLASKDPIVRNRLSELFIMGVYQQADASLTPQAAMKYYEEHRDKYLAPERRRIRHIFVRVTNLTDDAKARATLEKLRKQALRPESEWSDELRNALEPAWVTRDDLRGSFGPSFSNQVFAMTVGEWSEPIQSTSGWHYILVMERAQARMMEFAEARPEVENDLKSELRMQFYIKEIERLKSKYEVGITP